LSRAIPLFLAEQVEFGSDARVLTLVPWIAEGSGGFVLSGAAWSDEDAAGYARQGELKGDYIVITHLKTQSEPWNLELRLVRTLDGKRLGTLNATFASQKPEEAIPDLARRLLTLLSEQAEMDACPAPPLYQVPDGSQFPYYLLRLEQLLAVRCGGMDGVNQGFLHGERDILDGNLQSCLESPQNVPLRIVLAQTFVAMKKARPDILAEYKDKLMSLQQEKPLPEPAHGVVQRIANEIYSVAKGNA
jgi:hypothetical protein